MSEVRHEWLTIDGLRTHYLTAGAEGPPVVLLHSGEFGGCAESSWTTVLPGLVAAGCRVVAPDWLGFGRSDKVVDFADPKGRRMRHMAGFLESMDFDAPPVLVGNSMGATYLIQELAKDAPLFDARAAVVVSGGGFVPANAARETIQRYDLTREGMRDTLRVLLHDPRWAADEEYVTWRHELSLEPGAWACAASARLHPPRVAGSTGEFGLADDTAYEKVACPVLLVAGACDPLREEGYAEEIAAHLHDVELLVYEECGHMPNVEQSERFVGDLVEFLRRLRIL